MRQCPSRGAKKESPADLALLVAEGADGLDASGAIGRHDSGEDADGD
jgi:hypothetical protein